MRSLALLLVLLTSTLALAQDGASKVGIFQDAFGNVGSMWLLEVSGEKFAILEIDNRDKEGKAQIVLTKENLLLFEEQMMKLKQARNPHTREDGFSVLDSIKSDKAGFATIQARWHGVKVKMLQVTQEGLKHEQQMVLDKESYYSIKRVLKKMKRELD